MADSAAGLDGLVERQRKHKGKHDKPKPWDDPSIDHWKVVPFDPANNSGGLLEVSSFSTLFPQYREKYLQEVWPSVKGALKEVGIACELNLVEGSMTVSTTRKTLNPYIILKARDLIKLLSRSVPAPQAIKVLQDNIECDIIKIGSLIRNKDRFVKRRQYLIGPNSSTLKGNTVAAMGSHKGLEQARKIVEDCITNVQHLVYHIKTLLMKRELQKIQHLPMKTGIDFFQNLRRRMLSKRKLKVKRRNFTPHSIHHSNPARLILNWKVVNTF